jgi:hypothetical protein
MRGIGEGFVDDDEPGHGVLQFQLSAKSSGGQMKSQFPTPVLTGAVGEK